MPGGLASLLNRLVNRWVAEIIARREREAARIALRQLDDRELKDIGRHRPAVGFPGSPANGRGCSKADKRAREEISARSPDGALAKSGTTAQSIPGLRHRTALSRRSVGFIRATGCRLSYQASMQGRLR